MLMKPATTEWSAFEAACGYAARGWPVFPLHTVINGACTCHTPGCTTPGKHPRTPHGLKEATTEEEKIHEWWARQPQSNIGLVTGSTSGLIVLDVDPAKGGDDSLQEMERKHGGLPKTVEALTGGGGRHLYFAHPGDVVRNSAGRLGPGLDVRGDGGYVVAPPSHHVSGRTYVWECMAHPKDVPVASAPAWLIMPLKDKPVQQSEAGSSAPIPDGQRNQTLTSLAGSMRRRGMSMAAMEAALLTENIARCRPPLSDEEVRAIAASVARYPAGGPSDVRLAVDLSAALVTYPDLLSLKIPERPYYLPWFPEGSNVMVYGRRGVGKTFLQLGLAVALTTGKEFLKWKVASPVGVLYVDGEMQLDDLRARTTALMDTLPTAPLQFLTSQLVYQRCGGKDLILTSEAMRQEVVKILDARPDIRVLILDNISCLFSGIDENSKRDWEPINAWLIRLRHRGLATVLVHHAGNSGHQRGTSGREDSLDTVIHLATPVGADARDGCHFELSFEKNRSVTGEDVAPLDVRLQAVNGRLQWLWQPMEVSTLARARQLFLEGVSSPTELSEELGINKGYASRLLKKLRAEVAA